MRAFLLLSKALYAFIVLPTKYDCNILSQTTVVRYDLLFKETSHFHDYETEPLSKDYFCKITYDRLYHAADTLSCFES